MVSLAFPSKQMHGSRTGRAAMFDNLKPEPASLGPLVLDLALVVCFFGGEKCMGEPCERFGLRFQAEVMRASASAPPQEEQPLMKAGARSLRNPEPQVAGWKSKAAVPGLSVGGSQPGFFPWNPTRFGRRKLSKKLFLHFHHS